MLGEPAETPNTGRMQEARSGEGHPGARRAYEVTRAGIEPAAQGLEDELRPFQAGSGRSFPLLGLRK